MCLLNLRPRETAGKGVDAYPRKHAEEVPAARLHSGFVLWMHAWQSCACCQVGSSFRLWWTGKAGWWDHQAPQSGVPMYASLHYAVMRPEWLLGGVAIYLLGKCSIHGLRMAATSDTHLDMIVHVMWSAKVLNDNPEIGNDYAVWYKKSCTDAVCLAVCCCHAVYIRYATLLPYA